MTTFAVIAMGQMGAGIARRLSRNGARVLTSLDGRSASSAERAGKAGAANASHAEIVEQASLILSILPPASAPDLAQRFLPLLQQAKSPPMFLDCNAIAPSTVRDIAAPFVESGLSFGDASIIGPPPRPDDVGPRLYMSGIVGPAAESLRDHGIDTRVMSETVGDASSIKMAYAGITKGFQALGTAMATGAARTGVIGPLIEELNFSQDAIYGWLARNLPGMPDKAYRWDGEMREIAKFLSPEKGGAAMLSGAADLFVQIAGEMADGDRSDLLDAVERFARR